MEFFVVACYTCYFFPFKTVVDIALPFLRFPEDKETYAIDGQFFWGKSLLISPVLESVGGGKELEKLADDLESSEAKQYN